MKKLNQKIQKILITLIKFYQKTFSFDHGPLRHLYPHGFCRFYPSCSQYAIESIAKYGIIRGSVRSAWRLLRCNPFSAGGSDPV